jgi:DNA mismatch repair protein MutL
MNPCRIRVLPDGLVNQIAAGEVVERPASVVKELVENALDAEADRVDVEVGRAGLGRIRVTDNGRGMTPEEAVLAMQRHATSKIANADDLASIRTLGFRGEALPSIASVSRFTLVTREREANAGVRVDGRTLSVEPAACPPGTSVTVGDLFFNVPARLKFQKGERSQMAAIHDVVARAALAHPDVHFTLSAASQDEGRRPRRILELPPCRTFEDRASLVFGPDSAGRVFPVEAEGEGIRVTGVAGDPAFGRPDPGRIVLIVNGRPVLDPSLRRAVVQAYSVLVPAGRYPVVVLRIDLDPADVDVNVHPQKTEVRFRRHADVASVAFEAVQRAVAATPWVRGLPAESGGGLPVPTGPHGIGLPASARCGSVDSVSVPGPRESALPLLRESRGRFSSLRFVGQVANTILVCEGADALVLIDQHAAHERVNFDRLWTGLSTGRSSRESLLFPEIVTLPPADASRYSDAASDLERLGFDLEPYSGDSLAIRAVPAILKGRSASAVIRDCLAALAESSEATGGGRLHRIVSTVACHASVRAGDPLDPATVRALLASMDGIDLAAYCPHGRQAVVAHPLAAVLRWFGR